MPITLFTDFGQTDTYVGQMKGVIASIAPRANVIDLSHDVPPQDLLAGALRLDAAIDAFPADTIHVAVIDPGVGSDRLAIAAPASGSRSSAPTTACSLPSGSAIHHSRSWR